MTTPTRTNRRRQFSLLSLLIAVTLLSILLGLLGIKTGQIKRERAAAVAIEELGGTVRWAYSPFTGSAWLQSLMSLKDGISGHVIFVELNGTQVKDVDLTHLKGLSELRLLDLSRTQISDAGVKHLQEVGLLEVVFLSGTIITDAGLEHLAVLNRLRSLDFSGTQITDAGLQHLERLKALTKVILTDTKVTDEGVKKFQLAVPACEIVR